MGSFTSPFRELAEYEEAGRQLKNSIGVIEMTGCADPQKLHMVSGMSDDFAYKVIVTFREQKAREIYEDYRFYDDKVMLFPSKDLIFYQAELTGNDITSQRMMVYKALLEKNDVTIVTTIDAFLSRLVPLDRIADSIIYIDSDEELNLNEITRNLTKAGYIRNFQVEGKGEFSIRGGILDIFPLTEENPIRIELWGDSIESIRSFDILTQRSLETLTSIEIYPAVETVLSESEIEEGLERIRKEAGEQEEKLRSNGLSEGAYRAKKIYELISEEISNLGISGYNMDSYITYFYNDLETLIDYLPQDKTAIFIDEISRCFESAGAVELEFNEAMKHRLEKGYCLPGQTKIIVSKEELFGRLERRHTLSMSALSMTRGICKSENQFNIISKSINSYNNNFDELIVDLKRYTKNKYRVVLISASRTRAERLSGDLVENGLPCFFSDNRDRDMQAGQIMVTYGRLRAGFEYPLIKFVVISESDIFVQRQKNKRTQVKYEGRKITGFSELSVGDYVVHASHGVGIYRGIEQVTVDHVTKDYMKISYKDGGNLYIPATQLESVQKYSSKEGATPKLNKLGGTEWIKTRSRVKEAVDIIATDLVELYATRQTKQGYIYGPDTVWQTEFEELFPFEETEDQLQAIKDTKRDMESHKIMDRLICGDVGYGKTEIAIRAAFKAVQEGKQVVYLVPTTILAQQHYTTFVQRMKEFPVKIGLLCRFRTTAQQKKTIAELKSGMMDIVIGTHRVLSDDVGYKDLGLLIIDEEQRFGVTHKEKIKKLRNNIDVLTLTATPIPRTLHMSLIGIRDMSVLMEAPQDRVPIQTFVMEYNEELVREAIYRELSRGGQVFYVYNRVQTIADMAALLQNLLPDAVVSYAHGQMKEAELERIMYDFVSGEIDVLVSTTIIETGLDIANVNTMIIHDADKLGLSQLYQLRGRIGRSNRTAYAFLMYQRNKLLKETAEKRLTAIRDFTELGSGFKIAMRDLEIRGAGNLLGKRQSGNMDAVGYDMYCKLLNEAVLRKKGEDVVEESDVTIDINIDAYIPDSYIANEFQKMDVYKRISCINSKDEKEDMQDELYDRFGKIEKPVQNLLEVAYLKVMAKAVFVTDIKEEASAVQFIVSPKATYNTEKIGPFIAGFKGNLKLVATKKPYFLLKKRKGAQGEDYIMETCREMLTDLKELL